MAYGCIKVFRIIIERFGWLILLLLGGSAVFFGAWIPRLEINAKPDAFLEEDDPGLATYMETREVWGIDEYAIFCVTADDWFTESGIQRLKEIETDLQSIPFVESVMSILDVPLLRQEPEKKPSLFRLKKAVKYLRNPGIDLDSAGQEIRSHALTVGNLISGDGRSLNLLAYVSDEKIDGKFEPDFESRRHLMVVGVRETAAKWTGKLEEPVRLSGIPLVNVTLFENIRHDLVVFGIASLLVFILAFLLVYRRIRFVIIPVICCLLPAVGVLGAMSFFEIPVALVTSNVPVLLFVLMLPYNVYFIERYRERRAQDPDEEGLSSTLYSLRSIAVPCFFSCATTLAGFAALSTSRIIPIRDFGRTMTIGVAIGFCVVFLFIPAASRWLRGLRIKHADNERFRPSHGLVRLFERLALSHPGLVVAASILILAVSVTGARRISAENKITSYFWPGSEVYRGLEFIDKEMGGTTWIEVILTSKEPGFFLTKAGLDALARAESFFEEVPETGNILSLTRLRDELRKTFRPEWFPGLEDAAILQMINLASPDLLGQMTDREFTTGRTTVRMQETAPTLHRSRILAGLERHLGENSDAFENLEVEVTGVFPVYTRMLQQLLEGQKRSIIVVPLAVYLMLLVLFRSPLLALLVLLPQALPATVLLGVMGWSGIPLDLVTVMIASIAIGVGIDAAIQYTMRFRAELETTGDHRAAMRRAHATIGRAIWTATSIIVAGFAILVLSDFFPSVWFGLFTALAMLISQLATLTLLPSLFLLTGQPKLRAAD